MRNGRHWLIDTSALIRLVDSPDLPEWADRVQRGVVRIAPPTLLEVGFSARNAEDWRANIWGRPVSLMPWQGATPASERRALEVQELLVQRGHHRAPSVPDLMIAAIAETTGLTVLHVDTDFELIAEVTQQPTERLRLADSDRTDHTDSITGTRNLIAERRDKGHRDE